MYIPKRKYYSSRIKKCKLDKDDLCRKIINAYQYFSGKDYFKEKLGITGSHCPKEAEYKAVMALGYQIFPITELVVYVTSEDKIFDMIEFLYDHVSKPGDLVYTT